MQSFQSPDPLKILETLPDWKARKLSNVEISWYIGTIKNETTRLRERLEWLGGWESFFQEEAGKRKTAAAEIRRREQRDADQARRLAIRNAALEMQHHRDTYAE